jgi:hypothetical protein
MSLIVWIQAVEPMQKKLASKGLYQEKTKLKKDRLSEQESILTQIGYVF